jgi:C4-dicarboxylate-specific signal transduction histidine kinase
MMQFSTDQWIIVALVFLLGLFIGGFIFSSGGRKWKHRYRNEQERREQLELNIAEREKEWRERDSLRAAALKDSDRQINPVHADDPVP